MNAFMNILPNLPYLNQSALKLFISQALFEDVRDGDHSSLGSIASSETSRAQLIVKSEGIIAGVTMAEHIFHEVDADLEVETFVKDGDLVKYGDIGLKVSGKAQSILRAERLALNCLQRMSAIATYTHKLSSMIAHTNAKLLDTRKTTPNFRLAEKWAVRIGGGVNHRYGLFDMVMLKDNHIDFAGGVENAIEKTNQYLQENNLNLRIEIEVRNLEELDEVLKVGRVHRIMLDNMTPEDMKKAVGLIGGKYETEASGGINETNIVAAAESGVDFISVGSLTHSYHSLDMSLKAF